MGQAAVDAVSANAGLAFQWGAIDFAGGTVVHINSGIAGFMGALLVGKRVGFGREAMPPHSLTMTLIGASLLWVGWFGFNAGSALEASGTAALAMINTFVATAAAALAWMLAEKFAKGKPSLLGGASGAVAGLVAVTPASGYAGPMGALVLGLVAGIACMFMCSAVKNAMGYDDALDVFGVHALGGIFGALTTGIFNAPSLGGPGSVQDWVTMKSGYPGIWAQFVIQFKAVALVTCWTAVVALIAFTVVKVVMGLRVPEEEEREGLDITTHGERAYTG